MTITDPAQWLADYEQTLANTAANAQQAGENLRQVNGTATAPHGEVTVEVGAGGALTDLRLTAAARALEADQLARLILATAQQAQRAAGTRVVEIMTAYVGDGPALDLVKQNLPAAATAEPEPDLAPVGALVDTRADDDYFSNPPEIVQ
ncbi:MAG TPA: YbaB/EbfC family nucleoid-associated protein [Pseudonocardiaceae bacterium]|jgi:DNA-binding protein YbaB|nr:YbaB/EbfC family nucleoid-associated protein [Pseudonocardiaceae bacterium]